MASHGQRVFLCLQVSDWATEVYKWNNFFFFLWSFLPFFPPCGHPQVPTHCGSSENLVLKVLRAREGELRWLSFCWMEVGEKAKGRGEPKTLYLLSIDPKFCKHITSPGSTGLFHAVLPLIRFLYLCAFEEELPSHVPTW